jgi:hypothetical protein
MLTKLDTTPGAPTSKNLDVSFDVGKTLAVVIIAIVIFVGALILYLNDKDPAAASFFAAGEALLTGGLGIAFGESSGANAAANKLKSQ